MPRGNRYHLPSYVWHITHRCHKQDFLLKFARDRRRWEYWLFEARKRYGITVLNYMVTSNHVHLLVEDTGSPDGIARSMQLVAGRTGQEYNQRKGRGGAFWEDRYHATVVETGKHLRRCMTYIDLNMCRAGQVSHPCEWEHCGYRALQSPPQRYRIIDVERAAELLGCENRQQLAEQQRAWIEEALKEERGAHRDPQWSEHLAVGDEPFIHEVAKKLGFQGRFRKIDSADDHMVLREKPSSYNDYFATENNDLRVDNTHLWRLSPCT